MNIVEPIRDRRIIEEFKEVLLDHNYKYYIMFVIGLNSGLRISDILPLRVADVQNKVRLELHEKKTGKLLKFYINDTLRSELTKYIAAKKLKSSDYLIPSNKKTEEGQRKPIARKQAYEVLNIAADKIGYTQKIGTHTMRKTFGYWHYKQFKDVALLQNIFNHSSPFFTLCYIGINQDEMDESYRGFSL